MKEFLSQRGISFIERDVTRDPNAARELVARTGQMAVPVTIIDGETIIGFDRARIEQALARMKPGLGAAVADAAAKAGRAGAYVGKVRPGSPAEKMGLRPGDIIIQVNGQAVSNAADVARLISGSAKGSRVSILFQRGNNQLRAETSF